MANSNDTSVSKPVHTSTEKDTRAPATSTPKQRSGKVQGGDVSSGGKPRVS